MILKRVSAAIRARDWAAYVIEFSVVVIGIFVAIQVETWNQGRKDRELEQVYISRLIDETRANVESLNEHERIYEEKVDFLIGLSDLSLDDNVQRDPQAFMHQLDNSTYVALPDMRSETYQELESSGRLSLIRDTDLRSAIAKNLNDYRSVRPVLAQPMGDYRSILFETLPGRFYYDYRVGAGASNASAIVASVEAFRRDPRFEAAANTEITYGSDTLFWIREFKQRTKEILSRLQAESGRGGAN